MSTTLQDWANTMLPLRRTAPNRDTRFMAKCLAAVCLQAAEPEESEVAAFETEAEETSTASGGMGHTSYFVAIVIALALLCAWTGLCKL
jgi:hypothetical protein